MRAMSDSQNKTVRAAMEEAMGDIHNYGNLMKLYRFKDPVLKDYVIRTPQGYSAEELLSRTSSLCAPKYLFRGFAAGQPLMEGCIAEGPAMFEIIRFQDGQSLKELQFSANTDAYQRAFKDAWLKKGQSQEMLNEFFAQAAFCGIPNPRHTERQTDYNPGNQLLHDGRLSHVDRMGFEYQYKDADTTLSPKEWQRLHVESLFDEMKPVDTGLGSRKTREMLEKARDYAYDLIERDALESTYPEWKGFEKVDDVKAITPDASVKELKEALDSLYAQTGCAR